MKKLTGSVGLKADNKKNDVLIVQKLLNMHVIPSSHACIVEDGVVGPKTLSRIKLFQKNVVGLKVTDGRIDKDGKTSKKLYEVLDTSKPVHRANHGMQPDTVKAPKSVSELRFGVTGIAFLKRAERLYLYPYDDADSKRSQLERWVFGATIGYGHLISRQEWDRYQNGISEQEANVIFANDVDIFVKKVREKITVPLIQNEFDALVIFAYNIGNANFSNSSVVKMINDPEASVSYKGLEIAWKAWVYHQNKVSPGLINRRNAEWDIYNKNVYKNW